MVITEVEMGAIAILRLHRHLADVSDEQILYVLRRAIGDEAKFSLYPPRSISLYVEAFRYSKAVLEAVSRPGGVTR
ncbi:UNVERIFIED_ORG: hypothetical protein M2348_000044 [Sphingomonas sp. R1F5B]